LAFGAKTLFDYATEERQNAPPATTPESRQAVALEGGQKNWRRSGGLVPGRDGKIKNLRAIYSESAQVSAGRETAEPVGSPPVCAMAKG